MMRKSTHRFMITWLVTMLSVTILVAQGTCSELIEQALLAVDENCDTLDRNNVCYGYDFVQAAFQSEVPEDFFTLPADTAGILDLETIATAALDETNDTWGVAIMSVQANIPNTLPGQNVTFVLMGDTEVENAVATEDAFEPSDGIDVTIATPSGANIRTGPGVNFNVLGGAQPDSTLKADGQSEDGEWLRVAYRDRVAWVSKSVLAEDAAINELPVLSPELRTSMQAFYLRTGIGETTCEESPEDILVVQGPDNIEIELNVNGANVEIGSTIGLRIIYRDGIPYLEVIVFAGRGKVNGVTVLPGYRTIMCLGEEESRGLDGDSNDLIVTCDPSVPELIENFGEQWCYLEQLPLSILNYQIQILCPGETPPPPPPPTGGTASNSEIPEVDCSTFALIAPLIPVDAGNHRFSWTAAGGENLQYELVFYNVDGNQVETFYTTETFYDLNLGAQTATGGEFSWEVRLRQNGQYACVTARSPRLARTNDADLPPTSAGATAGNTGGGSGFSASIVACAPGRITTVRISWSGAGASDTISATSNEGATGGGSGASGVFSMSQVGPAITGIKVSSSSGGSAFAGDCR